MALNNVLKESCGDLNVSIEGSSQKVEIELEFNDEDITEIFNILDLKKQDSLVFENEPKKSKKVSQKKLDKRVSSELQKEKNKDEEKKDSFEDFFEFSSPNLFRSSIAFLEQGFVAKQESDHTKIDEENARDVEEEQKRNEKPKISKSVSQKNRSAKKSESVVPPKTTSSSKKRSSDQIEKEGEKKEEQNKKVAPKKKNTTSSTKTNPSSSKKQTKQPKKSNKENIAPPQPPNKRKNTKNENSSKKKTKKSASSENENVFDHFNNDTSNIKRSVVINERDPFVPISLNSHLNSIENQHSNFKKKIDLFSSFLAPNHLNNNQSHPPNHSSSKIGSTGLNPHFTSSNQIQLFSDNFNFNAHPPLLDTTFNLSKEDKQIELALHSLNSAISKRLEEREINVNDSKKKFLLKIKSHIEDLQNRHSHETQSFLDLYKRKIDSFHSSLHDCNQNMKSSLQVFQNQFFSFQNFLQKISSDFSDFQNSFRNDFSVISSRHLNERKSLVDQCEQDQIKFKESIQNISSVIKKKIYFFILLFIFIFIFIFILIYFYLFYFYFNLFYFYFFSLEQSFFAFQLHQEHSVDRLNGS